MGEEHDEARPFQFFTDHVDPFIADATREGRRAEFERFAAFSGEDVPDPYYGDATDFDEVLDIVTRTARALLEELRPRPSV